MNTNNLMLTILAVIAAMIILSIAAASIIATVEENERKNRKHYIFPVFHRKDFESYPAPYCPHCSKRLYNKQKFCQECGAGFIWPHVEAPKTLETFLSQRRNEIATDFNKKGIY